MSIDSKSMRTSKFDTEGSIDAHNSSNCSALIVGVTHCEFLNFVYFEWFHNVDAFSRG
jgi:hypothetical protein